VKTHLRYLRKFSVPFIIADFEGKSNGNRTKNTSRQPAAAGGGRAAANNNLILCSSIQNFSVV
jgi:hypothetical protein